MIFFFFFLWGGGAGLENWESEINVMTCSQTLAPTPETPR